MRTSNAGVEQAVRTLRLELEGTGIRVGDVRLGNTAGTEFATGELENRRAFEGNPRWFRMNLLRHSGLMWPPDVADVAAAVTLPAGPPDSGR